MLKSLNSEKLFFTPEDPSIRGCQISIHVKEKGKDLFNALTNEGVVCDWREPDVIRIAPVPLYNRFIEVYEFIEILKTVLM